MNQPLKPGPAVPQEYIGVWKRTLLRTPKMEDTTSQVYWMQTQSWHADIRVPAARPACTGRSSLDQLSREQLLGLAGQQGFSGTTLVEGDVCRWLRHHDFQPPSGANDIGRMEFETPDRMFEYGVEADYFEIWERLPGTSGASFALQADTKPLTLVFSTGEFLMRVRPRPDSLGLAVSLADLAGHKPDDAVRALVDFEISFGRRSGDSWHIDLSTLPWLQGTVVAVPR